MAVMLPNAQLTARKRAHAFARDAHGYPVAGEATVTEVGPYPGAVIEPDEVDGSFAYRLRVDPRAHPLRADDVLEDDQARVFIVRTAKLVSVPGNDAVDFIRVTADLDPPQVP